MTEECPECHAPVSADHPADDCPIMAVVRAGRNSEPRLAFVSPVLIGRREPPPKEPM